jgi:hypothetical protein
MFLVFLSTDKADPNREQKKSKLPKNIYMAIFVTNWEQIQIQKCSSVLYFLEISRKDAKLSSSFDLFKRSSKLDLTSHNPFHNTPLIIFFKSSRDYLRTARLI